MLYLAYSWRATMPALWLAGTVGLWAAPALASSPPATAYGLGSSCASAEGLLDANALESASAIVGRIHFVGGENSTRFEVEDYNFLGSGRELVIRYKSSVDRDSSLLRYRAPALGGRRIHLEAAYEDNSDGGRMLLHLERPFYTLDTRWAAGLEAYQEEREDFLYSAGTKRQPFGHNIDFLETYVGNSRGLAGGKARRYSAGLTYSRHRFRRSSLGSEPREAPTSTRLFLSIARPTSRGSNG